MVCNLLCFLNSATSAKVLFYMEVAQSCYIAISNYGQLVENNQVKFLGCQYLEMAFARGLRRHKRWTRWVSSPQGGELLQDRGDYSWKN
jgi:hypothetical protein